jgi:hypothetical protein
MNRPSAYGAYTVRCPRCGAPVGVPCTDAPRRADARQMWIPGTGKYRAPHIERQREWRKGGWQ